MPRISRPRPRRRQQQLSFSAIEIVGGLLTPDILARIAEPDGDARTRRGYGIPDGLELRDEIARAFRIAEAQWARFDAARDGNPGLPARFVPDLLRTVFGFDDLAETAPVHKGERVFPIRHTARGGRVPIAVAPLIDPGQRRTGLDVLHQAFADGPRRRSATLLLQEYLNASDEALWGLATDGLTLRLLRDNLSLTRPAWIEIDLAKIFTDGLFADFAAFWLLIHATRFGSASTAPSDCPLERWRDQGKEEGVTARGQLRRGVEAALQLLGQGALEHSANAALRDALATGSLSPQRFYEELLGTVYRLIFLFAAEDRDLLHPPGTSRQAREAYARGYAIGRLRERCLKRTAWDRHHDAWEGLRALFRALVRGGQEVGLPGLGGLFHPNRTPHLDQCRIGNRQLMEAIFRLAWIRPAGQSLSRVNWRDMETEELGSVYEGLLELIPELDLDTRSFRFVDQTGAIGSERKSTGSYYTPDALVKLVLDTTLDPLLDRAEAAPEPERAILQLAILDPACGSGHFLLGAARRAAIRLATIRAVARGDDMFGRDDFQHALREVVGHCIHGVDKNPLAVELCKVALWIEALEPGKPLGFLDDKIVCGDALIGLFDVAVLTDGIPDAAYAELTGDDKTAARLYKRWNKEQREGKGAKGLFAELRRPEALVDEARRVAAMPEDTVDEIAAKAKAFDRLHSGENWRRRQEAADLYVAAFFTPKLPLPEAESELVGKHVALAKPSVPLTEHVWAAARGQQVYPPLVAAAQSLIFELGLLHWPLAFPQIMAKGGFDAVIGNPPWEVSQFSDVEFFRPRAPTIAALAGDERKRAIANLETDNPPLWALHEVARRSFEAVNVFYRDSTRFDLTAKGKLNTYALFAELFARAIQPEGRAGVIVPTGIATDSSTSAFFGWLIDQKRLATLIDFENRRGIFRSVHRSYKFSILSLGKADQAAFAFFLLATTDLEDERRRFTLTPEQIARINPNTKTAPIFRSRADAEITARIYDRVPVLIRESEEDTDAGNPWRLTFQQGLFNMTSASEHFRTANRLADESFERDGTDWVSADGEERYVPLFEAKMIHHFDHRWATYGDGQAVDEEGVRDATPAEKTDPTFEPQPRYWVPEAEVRLRAARVSSGLKSAVRDGDAAKALKALGEHLAAAWPAVHGRDARGDDLTRTLGRGQAWTEALGATPDAWLRRPATQKGLAERQRKTPLDADDLRALAEGPPDPLAKAELLIERKQPRWLMGWRDICRSTDERTVIATVFPKYGTGDTLLLKYPIQVPPRQAACLTASLCSFALDFVARQKVGGTHLKYNVFKQLALLPPSVFMAIDLEFITPRVLELTYTSHAMHPWAEDLGHAGPPFTWDPDRRARLRAELDGFMARKYGLTKDELRYVLDPACVHGPDYPSETFRVLKANEINRFGEYRTRRLVLAAYDALEGVR
jgi:hypothetical protein